MRTACAVPRARAREPGQAAGSGRQCRESAQLCDVTAATGVDAGEHRSGLHRPNTLILPERGTYFTFLARCVDAESALYGLECHRDASSGWGAEGPYPPWGSNAPYARLRRLHNPGDGKDRGAGSRDGSRGDRGYQHSRRDHRASCPGSAVGISDPSPGHGPRTLFPGALGSRWAGHGEFTDHMCPHMFFDRRNQMRRDHPHL